jgi:hypothetical protein
MALGNDRWTNTEDICGTLVDPHTISNLLVVPILGARTYYEDCPRKADKTTKRRVLDAKFIPEVNDMIFYENNRCLSDKEGESGIIIQGAMHKHARAAMHNRRDTETGKKLEVS